MSATISNNYNHNISIIIPTFREVDNLAELVSRIAALDFGGRLFEVLVIDDNSQDGTVELVNQLQQQYAWLKLIVRHGEKSLSQSVIDGFRLAQYPLLVTMDADLSHPPEKIPHMIAVLELPEIDFVIGSRYIKGGSIDDSWPLSRKIVSRFAAMLARILLIWQVKDPLSGFMAIKKERFLAGDTLDPIGWKIGLELMVKCHCNNIKEVPINFSERRRGFSKLSSKAIISYIKHLKRLVFYRIFQAKRK